eukprot:gene9255-10233_t
MFYAFALKKNDKVSGQQRAAEDRRGSAAFLGHNTDYDAENGEEYDADGRRLSTVSDISQTSHVTGNDLIEDAKVRAAKAEGEALVDGPASADSDANIGSVKASAPDANATSTGALKTGSFNANVTSTGALKTGSSNANVTSTGAVKDGSTAVRITTATSAVISPRKADGTIKPCPTRIVDRVKARTTKTSSGIVINGTRSVHSSKASLIAASSVYGSREDFRLSEAELQWQESPREERQSVVSTASLPMGNGVSRPRMKSDSFRDRAATMPNSVGASKNSIRSRKDSLLKRLNSGQSRDDEEQDNNDKNEELVLNAIQDGSRASFRRMSATPTRSESRRLSLPGQQSPRPDLQETNGNEAFSRRKSLRGSQRGSSLDNEIVEDAEESENTAEKSSQETGRIRKTPILTSLINEVDTFSLPPLPLKGTQAGLSVTERTFSAPMLPFTIEPDGLPVPNLTQRPGSSGSQVVARSKKKSSLQVRNELIDKEMLDNDDYIIRGRERADTNERFAKHRGSVLDNGSFFRKNSYDTNSTNEIVAHRDSVPILAIEPKNRWFASGSSDRSMKIWDINTGACRLTVRDHKAGIRALTFGITGHRFLFSAGDDRQLLCTDIEVNRVIHKYPDQNSVIYAMTMYAPSELLVTCGRDKHVKIWDTREKKCVKTMRGHINSVSSLAILENSRQSDDDEQLDDESLFPSKIGVPFPKKFPEKLFEKGTLIICFSIARNSSRAIISGSHDSTMRIWDIGEGRCTQILMGHEKSVRSIVVHPEEPIISSASTERVIHWKMPDGEKKQEITSKDISINCISVNPQGALVAAGSNGVIHLWDWRTGHKFQKIHRTKVYQSQEVPICVFCVAFDKTGSRLIVSDASNVVKVYREAYTRVRRRQNTGDTVKTVQKKRSLFSKYSTSDYAYT